MSEFSKFTLPVLLETTAQKHAARPAVAFVGETPLTYHEFFSRTQAVTALLEKLGVQPGDRVALLSSNMPHWGIAYFGIVSMGAIVVPLLPDFSAVEIKNVLRHSRAMALFVSEGLRAKVDSANIHSLQHKIAIEDFRVFEGQTEVDFVEKAVPEKIIRWRKKMLRPSFILRELPGSQKG